MKTIFNRVSPLQVAWTLGVLALVALALFTHNYEAAVMLAPGAVADPEEIAKELKSTVDKVTSIREDMAKMHTEVQTITTKFKEGLPEDLKTAIDKALTGFNTLSTQVKALEQKAAEGADQLDREQKAQKTWGELFVESKNYKDAGGGQEGELSSKRGTVAVAMESKMVNSAAAGGLIRSFRESGVVELPRERFTIRDLMPTVQVSTSSVDYAVQATRTNAAAPVAESLAKPYSDFTWTSATVVVRVLAHLAKITRQAMDDAPRLIGEIDSELRYGLGFVEERQFLFGNGTGQNLHGIMPQATVFARPAAFPTRPASPGVTKIDVLRVAMLQNSLALYPATGIVLNEVDWADIETTKTTDGAYLFANPQGSVAPRMWSLPVVATPAMTAGDFLVGNFRVGATIYDRMAVEVLISTENVDDFEKNLATMRAEQRVAIAVKRPLAFTKGTFATAITALTTP